MEDKWFYGRVKHGDRIKRKGLEIKLEQSQGAHQWTAIKGFSQKIKLNVNSANKMILQTDENSIKCQQKR